MTEWPAPIAKYAVSPARLRVRPQRWQSTAFILLLCGVFLILIAPVAMIAESVARGSMLLLAGAALASLPLTSRLRWFELERTATGWRLRRGIAGWTRTVEELPDRRIEAVFVARDNRIFDYWINWKRHHVRIAVATLPFGRSQSIELGDGFGWSDDEVFALGQVLQSATTAATP